MNHLQCNAMSVHPAGERPSVVSSLPFRVFRVFRGFNCCFQVQRFGLEKAVQPRISRITRIKKGLRWSPIFLSHPCCCRPVPGSALSVLSVQSVVRIRISDFRLRRAVSICAICGKRLQTTGLTTGLWSPAKMCHRSTGRIRELLVLGRSAGILPA
jgi:hypothetical protein